jgi:electron transfer flavoprotein beta subunit
MSDVVTPANPLIAACLRITDLRPEVGPLTGEVTHDRLAVGLSAADAAALEHALRIGEAWSGRVAVVTIAARSSEEVLRDISALGVDVLRVPDADAAEDHARATELAGDERGLARAAAAALASLGRPAVVLCGDRSADRGTGAFPAFLAHELGAAQALGLVRLTPNDNGSALLAERRLDGGWREQLSVPLPAVCSVEGAGVRLRRATLAGALAATDRQVPVDDAAAGVLQVSRGATSTLRLGPTRPFEPRTRVVPAPAGGTAHQRVLALTGALDARDPPTLVGPMGAAEAADVLLEYLVRHGYLEDPAALGAAPPEPEASP